MTITTYTDKEIALKAQLDAMTLERDEYQRAADKMAMEHKVERDTMRQQLAEAQALIEASWNEALEMAAKVCDAKADRVNSTWIPHECASQIRELAKEIK